MENRIEDIRTRNLKSLRDAHGIGWLEKNTGKSRSMLSQWINNSKSKTTGKPIYISSNTCRQLESVLSLPDRWFDQLHEEDPGSVMAAGQHLPPDTLSIPQYDTAGSMGNGLVLEQHVGTIRQIAVNSDWLRENLGGRKSVSGLCVVTGFGDSMEPLFRSGDPLIVDTNINEYVGEFPYFFRVGSEGYIKRLQRIPGEGYRAISENKRYETWTVRQGMDFAVLGKVIKAWHSCDF